MELFDFDPQAVDVESSYKKRYAEIERANDQSWYVTQQLRPFDAYLSVHSAGAPRDPIHPLSFEALHSPARKAARKILGGNMSLAATLGPQELSSEARLADAAENIERICADAGICSNQLRILKARQTNHDTSPLMPLNVDEFQVNPEGKGPLALPTVSDFIYSYDPEVVLAARPADCPIMLATAETPGGTISMLIHYSWRGVAHGYIEQTDRCFDELGVDRSTLRIYVSPGAHAENFSYERAVDPRKEFSLSPELFRDVHRESDSWIFGIDTPRYAYDHILQIPGITKEMIYADTSDTGAQRSGYSSHNRAFNQDPTHNTRDLLFMVRRPSAVQ